METPVNSTSEVSNSTPTEVTPTHPIAHKKTEFGPKVGIGIIITLLVIGGLYVWITTVNRQKAYQQEATSVVAPVTNIATPKDQPAQIQTDLNTFNASNFDSKINADLNAINTAIK